MVTIAFAAESVLHLYASPRPARDAFSALGIIDLAATVPVYLALFVPAAWSDAVLRGLRLLRLFRLFGPRKRALSNAYRKRLVCGACNARGHASDSRFCRMCAAPLVIGEFLNSSGSARIVGRPSDP